MTFKKTICALAAMSILSCNTWEQKTYDSAGNSKQGIEEKYKGVIPDQNLHTVKIYQLPPDFKKVINAGEHGNGGSGIYIIYENLEGDIVHYSHRGNVADKIIYKR